MSEKGQGTDEALPVGTGTVLAEPGSGSGGSAASTGRDRESREQPPRSTFTGGIDTPTTPPPDPLAGEDMPGPYGGSQASERPPETPATEPASGERAEPPEPSGPRGPTGPPAGYYEDEETGELREQVNPPDLNEIAEPMKPKQAMSEFMDEERAVMSDSRQPDQDPKSGDTGEHSV